MPLLLVLPRTLAPPSGRGKKPSPVNWCITGSLIQSSAGGPQEGSVTAIFYYTILTNPLFASEIPLSSPPGIRYALVGDRRLAL